MSRTISTTAAVILAAGAGRRFGGAKQVAIVDGEPMVRRACRVALEAGLAPVLVVLGAHAGEVAAAIADLPVRPVVNPRAAEGMGTSVAFAIALVERDPAVTAVAILLADQPWVPAAHLRALIAAGAPVAATRHGDAAGAPAVFARARFGALARLTGDRGARDLIAACPDRVVLSLGDAARDVDRLSETRSRARSSGSRRAAPRRPPPRRSRCRRPAAAPRRPGSGSRACRRPPSRSPS